MFHPPRSAKVAVLTLLLWSGSGAANAQAAPPPAAQPAAAAAPAPAGFAMSQPAPRTGQCAERHRQPQHCPLEGARTNPRRHAAGHRLHAAGPEYHAARTPDGAGRGRRAKVRPHCPPLLPSSVIWMLFMTYCFGSRKRRRWPGPRRMPSSLEDARAGLEDGRAKLGTWLLQSIGAQDAQIAHAGHCRPAARRTAPAPTKIVVDDGPDTPKPHKKKPPPAPAPQ